MTPPEICVDGLQLVDGHISTQLEELRDLCAVEVYDDSHYSHDLCARLRCILQGTKPCEEFFSFCR
jgi:hypothetical protein